MDCRPALHGAINKLSNTWAWPTARPVANSNADLKSSMACFRSRGLVDPGHRSVGSATGPTSQQLSALVGHRPNPPLMTRSCPNHSGSRRLRDLDAAGMKIQREREQNRQALLSDQELADELLVRPERWAAAVQSHEASQVIDLNATPGEPASSRTEDEHLDWLKSVLHQGDGLAGTVLQALSLIHI